MDGVHWTDDSKALIKPSSFSRSWAELQSVHEITSRAFPLSSHQNSSTHPCKLWTAIT